MFCLISFVVKFPNGKRQQYCFGYPTTCVIGKDYLKIDAFVDVARAIAKDENSDETKTALERCFGKGTILESVEKEHSDSFQIVEKPTTEMAKAFFESPCHLCIVRDVETKVNPNVQRRIVRDLVDLWQSSQFIITTNSPSIVQSLQNNELLNLDKVGLDDAEESPFEEGTAFPNFPFDTSRMSTEEILQNVFCVEDPQFSQLYKDFYDAAYKYYEILDHIKQYRDCSLEQKKEIAKKHLDRLSNRLQGSIEHSSFRAYQAYLEAKTLLTDLK